MLFTLFGDYVYPRGSDIWLGSLVEIASVLGISEVAVRSAVARLAQQRWIAARKVGNRSFYGLSESGRALIDEGTRRIYSRRHKPWDGHWCVLTYSIPEARRATRDRIRKRLAWLGFGAMGGGSYVSPRDVSEEVQTLLREHGAHGFARVFSGRLCGPGGDVELVRQCWDLASIGRKYGAFMEHYEPLYRRDARRRRSGTLKDADAFVARFALTHDFRRFPFIDPDLPESLLPPNWAGVRARALFDTYHNLLTDGALRFFDGAADVGGPSGHSATAARARGR